jgi:predicted metal-binding membrane protein
MEQDVEGTSQRTMPAQTRHIPLNPSASLPLYDHIVIWGGLGAITILSWLYLIWMPMPGAMMMNGMQMAMPMPYQGTAQEAWLTFVMWTVMMAAMMLPSVAPMVLMFARLRRGSGKSSSLDAWLFAFGYLIIWSLFSAIATAGQLALQRAAIISDALRFTPLLGGIVLIATGIYQLTPLKDACLAKCRSPISFFMTCWHEGGFGALRMGLNHGTFCVGCCWLLMALLFVAGAMNLLWVAAITALVLIEKVAPYGRKIASASGVVMIAAGSWLAVMR